jgi:ubiquinone/menaquinone biosynthesis C-methylase UbiE
MPQVSNAHEVKRTQHAHWNGAAAGWAARRAWTERHFAAVSEWFRSTGAWNRGSRVLDVACGGGYPALVAARDVGPSGHVLATDISEAMTAGTCEQAALAGLRNLDCRAMDAEHLELGDHMFDAVTNAYGLMFCPDLHAALTEARRVLRPGGIAALVTWDAMEQSPFFAAILPVAAKHLSLESPPPDAPGPFRLSDPEALRTVLERSGLTGIRVERTTMTIEFGSAEEYVAVFADLAWRTRIAALTGEAAAQFTRAVADATRPFVRDGRLRLAASSLCARATA